MADLLQRFQILSGVTLIPGRSCIVFDDWRLFAHSSVETVARIVRVLTATKRYAPRQSGQKVYLTHLARTLHGSHEEISARVPSPLAPAFDGLKILR